MEQRSDSLNPVVLGAGTDPTHIPGIDDPDTGEPPEDGAPSADATSGEAAAQDTAAEDLDANDPDAEDTDAEDGDPEDGDPEDAADDGPVFEVSDRRSTIRADRTGVTFRLDDTEAHIRWQEIGAVEVDIPRFKRRFSVTVYTTNHRHFDADVEAPAKRDLREWETGLDTALDTWFDAGTE